MEPKLKPLCRRGVAEISAAVGINSKRFAFYVQKKGLPAFKYEAAGTWIALDDDLAGWILEQKAKAHKK
jgi:hypothetical protein